MGYFLTAPARTQQVPRKGMYKLIDNELYMDDNGSINLHWRNFWTDNFTWIKKGDWDIRCSHGHDIGCKHHQIVKVNLSVVMLKRLGYLKEHKGITICHDIPKLYLEVVDITGHEVNNLFYRMLKAADCPVTPKYIQLAYRTGVAFNLNWFTTGKIKIDLDKLYDEDWNRQQ